MQSIISTTIKSGTVADGGTATRVPQTRLAPSQRDAGGPRAECSRPLCARHPRGTAEIELLLSMGVLITILLLTVGLLHLASARLSTAQTANYQAFHDAIQANTPQYADNASYPPLDGITSIRPGFPNRLHVPMPKQTVLFQNLKATTVGSWTAVAAPAWSYSCYPVGGDSSATAQWFTSYVDESHQGLYQPLGLSPAWAP